MLTLGASDCRVNRTLEYSEQINLVNVPRTSLLLVAFTALGRDLSTEYPRCELTLIYNTPNLLKVFTSKFPLLS